MSSPILEVNRLCFCCQGNTILRDVSLALFSGQRLALVGPNGAGKTTLLKCVHRIVTGWSGSVRLDRKDLATYSQRDLARWMAYVPQGVMVGSPFVVKDFVAMGRYAYQGLSGRLNADDRRAVEKALDLTDTMELQNRSLPTLSGGERQRVLLAAALAQETQLLLLDEPTAFLDPRNESAFWRVLSHVHHERKLTLITVTHDLNRAVLMHDRLLALKEGQVHYAGAAKDFMQEEHLSQVYDSPFLLTAHPQSEIPVVLPEVSAL